MTGKCLTNFRVVILVSFLFWFFLLCFQYSDSMVGGLNKVNSSVYSVDPSESNLLPADRNPSSEKIGEYFAESVDQIDNVEIEEQLISNSTDKRVGSLEKNPENSTQPVENKAQSIKRVPRRKGRGKKRTVKKTPSTRNGAETEQVIVKKKDPFDVAEPVIVAKLKDPFEATKNGVEAEPVIVNREEEVVKEEPEIDCSGRYIYMHRLPRCFNVDLLRSCRSLSNWTDMCEFSMNLGLGPKLANFEGLFSNTGWFATNQFLLEVIFHNRMKQYKCLTTNSSLASAIYVPFYAGLDVARYLWGSNTFMRDSASLDLVKWLTRKPEWKFMRGRDHFMVAGRICWDFRRFTDEDSNWGNKLMLLPETKNMTMLVIESSPWNNSDFAIPYPTYFHPSSDDEVFQWQNRMRRLKRPYLFSFAGAPRPNLKDSIRNEIMDQCRASGRKCWLLECLPKGNQCYKPEVLMRMFQSSEFCLQPPGDSFTRRSAFDSILAGCIPVFFHPGSAYVQYIWHLPKDYRNYSVFIPADDVKDGKVSIEEVLLRIPKKQVWEMREEVIRLIPNVIYADPSSRLETLEDAFDLAIKGVLGRIERLRKETREGRNTSFDIPENISWKYNLFGTLGEHEWDPFFSGTSYREKNSRKELKKKTIHL